MPRETEKHAERSRDLQREHLGDRGARALLERDEEMNDHYLTHEVELLGFDLVPRLGTGQDGLGKPLLDARTSAGS